MKEFETETAVSRPERPGGRLLIAHVVYRFDVGGLENGVVNLINRLPADRFQHAVIALTEVTDFRRRIAQPDVQYFSLHKRPGHGIRQWPQLYQLFRSLRPDVVHTRNMAPLEASLPAWLAGVPVRVHGEHGWDVGDLDGSNWKPRATRRFYRPFITRYVALSRHLAAYLQDGVGVPAYRISQIYNGVDTQRYNRPGRIRAAIAGSPFNDLRLWLAGTVGRLAAVKDQAALIYALAAACSRSTAAAERMRLAIIGDGPLRPELEAIARSQGVADKVWFSGMRDDIDDILRGLDVFALPSLAEGISNTLLEAMSSSLPVIATRVGGNVELVDDDVTGTLIEASDPQALTDALLDYFDDAALARRHGQAARHTVEDRFSLERMVADYAALYLSVAVQVPGRFQWLATETQNGI